MCCRYRKLCFFSHSCFRLFVQETIDGNRGHNPLPSSSTSNDTILVHRHRATNVRTVKHINKAQRSMAAILLHLNACTSCAPSCNESVSVRETHISAKQNTFTHELARGNRGSMALCILFIFELFNAFTQICNHFARLQISSYRLLCFGLIAMHNTVGECTGID